MIGHSKIFKKFKELLDAEQLDYSTKTLKAYEHVIKNLISYLGSMGIMKLNEVDLEILKQFVFYRPNKQPYKLNSINQRIAATELFFTWAFEQGYCRDNPVLMLKKQRIQPRKMSERIQPPIKDKEISILTPTEQAQLLTHLVAYKHDMAQIRDTCMIALILTSALYAEELINLRWQDLRIRNNQLTIKVAGKRARNIQIHDPNLQPFLTAWLITRHSLLKNKDCSLLFFTKNFKPITKALLYQQISTYFQKANIKKSQLGPDLLRQTAIVNMLQAAELNLEEVQKQIGHKQRISLERYVICYDSVDKL